MRSYLLTGVLAVFGASAAVSVWLGGGWESDPAWRRPGEIAGPGSQQTERLDPPRLMGRAGASKVPLGHAAFGGRPPDRAEGLPAPAVLRILGQVSVNPAGWVGGTPADIVARMRAATGVPFRVTERARRARGVPFWQSPAVPDTCASLLDAVAEANQLEWWIDGGEVQIALRGEGPAVLARELVDMAESGTWEERTWAGVVLASASGALRMAIEVVRKQPRPAAVARPSAEGAGQRPNGAHVELRLMDVALTLLEDVSVRFVGLGAMDDSLGAPGCRSVSRYLDDAEVEILGRAMLKSEPPGTAEVRSAWLPAGVQQVFRLADGGVLTLCVSPAPDPRFVRTDLRFRYIEGERLRFAPRLELGLPAGGTILVQAADGFPACDADPPRRVLLLTIEPAWR